MTKKTTTFMTSGRPADAPVAQDAPELGAELERAQVELLALTQRHAQVRAELADERRLRLDSEARVSELTRKLADYASHLRVAIPGCKW